MTQSTAPLTGAPSASALNAEEVAAIRADFPYLGRPARNGEVLAYLDWAATSQKPADVITTEADFYRASNGAAGRSTYQLADEATATFEDARDAVAAFVGARGSELVFTKNATEAINLVALAIGHASLGRSAARGGGPAAADDVARRLVIGEGDEVVVTRAEHHANLVPWQILAQRTGAKLRWLELTPDGRIDTDPALLAQAINSRTRVVALTHVSNVTGAITDLEPILAAVRAQERKPVVVLDTCQSSAHLPLSFAQLASAGVDAICLSSHKMLGPTGIGALVATEELLYSLPPVLSGGSKIELVDMEHSTYMAPPARFEAGTQPLAQAAGWHSAVDYLRELDLSRSMLNEHELTGQLIEGMNQVEGVRLLGPANTTQRLGVVAFEVEGVHPHDVGQVLDASGVAVRTGHHCAQPIHAHFGLRASARVSLGVYSTPADVRQFLDALQNVRKYFNR